MLLPRRVEEVVVSLPRQVYDKAVAELAKYGVLHPAQPPREAVKAGERPYTILHARVSEKVSRIETYYRVLGLEPESVKGLRLEGRSWEEVFEKIQAENRDLEEDFEKGIQRITELEALRDELASLVGLLELVKDIDVDIREAIDAEVIGLAVGFVRPGDEEELAYRVIEEAARSKGVVAAYEKRGRYILVAAAGDYRGVHGFVQEMRGLGWTPLLIPDWLPGSPAKAYEEARRRLEELDKEIEGVRARLLERKRELDRYYTLLSSLRSITRLLAATVFTRTMAVFRGFVDTRDSPRLRAILEKAVGRAFLVISLGVRRAEERVPSKVELPRLIRPFHKIVRLYGEPEPDEIVPTVFVAVTLPLIFGLMFPDMGHGLLVLLFAQWYFKRRDPDWRYILSVLGAASIVTGFLAGEFFGPLGAKLVGLPKLWETLGFHTPPLAQPTYAVEEGLGGEVAAEILMKILSLSLWLGAFMIVFGAFLGVVDAWIKGEKLDALLSKLPSFIFFLSAGLPFLATASATEGGRILKAALLGQGERGVLATIVLAGIIVGLVWKLAGSIVEEVLHGGRALSGLGHGILEVYEMFLMAMGNLPSFLRILGLGLAHSGLMLGFTQLYHAVAEAAVLPHALGVFFGAIVYAIGNLMVAALEAIIAFAHSLRLHFYEWFSKFYHGTGISFEPVKLEGVEVVLA